MNISRSLTSNTALNSVAINYIVYEKNDDGLLLECDITSNGNKYHSNICIDFQELNRLIGVISVEHNIDFYGLISEHIISNDNSICEVDITKELGQPIVLNQFSFDSINLQKAA